MTKTPTTTAATTQGQHPGRAALRTFLQAWVPLVVLFVGVLPEVLDVITDEAGAHLSEGARGVLLAMSTTAAVLAAIGARVMALEGVSRLIERYRLLRPLAPAPVPQDDRERWDGPDRRDGPLTA